MRSTTAHLQTSGSSMRNKYCNSKFHIPLTSLLIQAARRSLLSFFRKSKKALVQCPLAECVAHIMGDDGMGQVKQTVVCQTDAVTYSLWQHHRHLNLLEPQEQEPPPQQLEPLQALTDLPSSPNLLGDRETMLAQATFATALLPLSSPCGSLSPPSLTSIILL